MTAAALHHLDEARRQLETAQHCAADCPDATGEPRPRSSADFFRLQALRAAVEHMREAQRLVIAEWTSEERMELVEAAAKMMRRVA